MGAHYFIRDSEKFFDNAISAAKDFLVIEGASHGATPCTACQQTTGKYSNSVKNLFDQTKLWIDARLRICPSRNRDTTPPPGRRCRSATNVAVSGAIPHCPIS
jgi:hypothetical protein